MLVDFSYSTSINFELIRCNVPLYKQCLFTTKSHSKVTYLAVVSKTNMLTKLSYNVKKLLLWFEKMKNPRIEYRTTKNSIKINMSKIGGNDWNICLINRLTPPKWWVSRIKIGLRALVTRKCGVCRTIRTRTSIVITANVIP